MSLSPFVFFGDESSESIDGSIDSLGTKGFNLLNIFSLGLPVPSGFILDTSLGACIARGESVDFRSMLHHSISRLSSTSSKTFGDSTHPLLVSVRSGAPMSMPGMLDTVLNVGLTKSNVEGFATTHGDIKFAWDTYRRFIESFCVSVFCMDEGEFDDLAYSHCESHHCDSVSSLSLDALHKLIESYESLIESQGHVFPQDPFVQLEQSIMAVFGSWNSERAVKSRELNGISHDGGTAVIVQSMVFGNLPSASCSGVLTTRDPLTGEKSPFGEYIAGVQGEDIVSGFHTPYKLSEMSTHFPESYAQLVSQSSILEAHFREVQEIEFTVESGHLWFLQTRRAKQSAKAQLKTSLDMVDEGLITRADALSRCDDSIISALGNDSIVVPDSSAIIFAKGLSASPGSVSGHVYFSSASALRAKSDGTDIILLRPDTNPSDIHGIDASIGILTSRGGKTSHAAVIARGLHKPCITGAMSVKIDESALTATSGVHTICEGDLLTLDATNGLVYLGVQPIEIPQPDSNLSRFLSWRDESH